MNPPDMLIARSHRRGCYRREHRTDHHFRKRGLFELLRHRSTHLL